MENLETHENNLLLSSLQKFLEKEIYPFEEEVDRSGVVPIDLGLQIEKSSKEAGFFAAN